MVNRTPRASARCGAFLLAPTLLDRACLESLLGELAICSSASGRLEFGLISLRGACECGSRIGRSSLAQIVRRAISEQAGHIMRAMLAHIMLSAVVGRKYMQYLYKGCRYGYKREMYNHMVEWTPSLAPVGGKGGGIPLGSRFFAAF